jgi:hypothetical protein
MGTCTDVADRIAWPQVINQARDIVLGYGTLGCTLRQLWYRLFTSGVLPNRASVYRRLSARVAAARRAGDFPDLVDGTRTVHVPPAWQDAKTFLTSTTEHLFRLDRTRGQPIALYLGAEKDTLRAMLTSWTEDLGLPVLVIRGFGSQSYADLVRDRALCEERPVHLAYIGDLDASGTDIERDWVARTACWDQVTRIAVTFDQVAAYDLPPAPGKAGDPRWPGFAARHGLDPVRPVQWEVEALEPSELRRLVDAAVTPYVDRAALDAVLADEERQRAALTEHARRWTPPD